MTPALQAWLARADEAAAGGALPQAEAAGSATVLHLLRDGRVHSTVTLGERSLGLAPAEAQRAPPRSALSPETAGALKAALDDAVR